MDKRLIFLFIASTVVFMGIIFSINILIRRQGIESVVSQTPYQVKEHSPAKAPLEKNKVLKRDEEPERELPIQSNEPLLN